MHFRSRAYTLFELLIAIAILFALIFAVGDAIVHTVRMESLDAGRAAGVRSFSGLTARMSEEARSSTAVFIPSSDVLGGSNGDAGGAHEVDFYRRLSAGGDAFVAYRFDAVAHNVTRYEYSRSLGAPSIANADVVASDIAAFTAVRSAALDLPGVVGAGSAPRVAIMYGAQDVVGGNDVVAVTLQSLAIGGSPARCATLHLAPRIAPTSLAVLVPAVAPPSPTPVRSIPFVINLLHSGILSHGPVHFGDPGSEVPDPGRSSRVAGMFQFVGFIGSTVDWLALSDAYPSISNGTYEFVDSSGNRVTATVSCAQVDCPRFAPLPIVDASPSPNGGVTFQDSP
jgi:hypothetical protein